jgi:16S rRNA (cytosine967-C5)-methyltransferase
LWQQLQATAGALAAVAKGESANAALLRVANPLRPGVQSLLFATLRHWGRAHALRAILAQRSPPPEVDSLLCVALVLLAVWVSTYNRIPVEEAVLESHFGDEYRNYKSKTWRLFPGLY